MFRNSYQSGFLSILYSVGSKPLQIWDSEVNNGHIKRVTDSDIQSTVLEITGANVSTSHITCPPNKGTLGVRLPYLVMIIKNLNKYFTFEVTILDDKNMHRRFRASNFQTSTKVKTFDCTMPMKLDEGWNQVQFNLADFTNRAYGTNYVETLSVRIHANCRIRRIYFCDRLYNEEELPNDFKLFLPVSKNGGAKAQPAQHHQQQRSPRASNPLPRATEQKKTLSAAEKKPLQKLNSSSNSKIATPATEQVPIAAPEGQAEIKQEQKADTKVATEIQTQTEEAVTKTDDVVAPEQSAPQEQQGNETEAPLPKEQTPQIASQVEEQPQIEQQPAEEQNKE